MRSHRIEDLTELRITGNGFDAVDRVPVGRGILPTLIESQQGGSLQGEQRKPGQEGIRERDRGLDACVGQGSKTLTSSGDDCIRMEVLTQGTRGA